MHKDLTELVFIMDMSGSMQNLTEDTIGGFNSILENQKELPGEAYVTTVLFNNTASFFHDRVPIKDVPKLTQNEYIPKGATALLDSLGGAIEHIQTIHKYSREEDIPEKTLFVVTTDGLENASRKYTAQEVKLLVAKAREEGWEFLFLGADIDSFETAARLNFDPSRVTSYVKTSEGETVKSRAVGNAVRQIRVEKRISPEWKTEADEYYNKIQQT